MDKGEKRVVVGRISGLHGVRGWVKVFSYTEPREQVFSYQPWQLERAGQWHELTVVETAGSGKTLIARLPGVDSRDEAAPWVGTDIAVSRSLLPPSTHGAWLWADLEGLRVINSDSVDFGCVDHLIETGANDVLVVRGERERLIPLLPDRVVTKVDMEAGVIHVDWDADF